MGRATRPHRSRSRPEPRGYGLSDLPKLPTAPVIYSLVVPLALLDVWTSVYQAASFGLYGIERVRRADYFDFDRGRLPYLNAFERFNCDYCAYANGVLAYAREVAARTEQYFCPIKHARRRLNAHGRYGRFLDFGDAGAFREASPRLRDGLRETAPDQTPEERP